MEQIVLRNKNVGGAKSGVSFDYFLNKVSCNRKFEFAKQFKRSEILFKFYKKYLFLKRLPLFPKFSKNYYHTTRNEKFGGAMSGDQAGISQKIACKDL